MTHNTAGNALKRPLTAEDAAILARAPDRSRLGIRTDVYDFHSLTIGLRDGMTARCGARLDTMAMADDVEGMPC